MPIYEYRCNDCGHQLDALQKMSDDVLIDCPECHKPTLVKIISAPAFRLSGSGWYETDFKSGNKKNLAGDAGETNANNSNKEGKEDKSTKNTEKKSSPSSDKKASATSKASSVTKKH
ncbi:MAG: putative FmdB family regulatory protein [Cellvibrionaceae bacterium]|jgi:putative FmdB family regulatory protein